MVIPLPSTTSPATIGKLLIHKGEAPNKVWIQRAPELSHQSKTEAFTLIVCSKTQALRPDIARNKRKRSRITRTVPKLMYIIFLS
jgi:hypothetical protein